MDDKNKILLLAEIYKVNSEIINAVIDQIQRIDMFEEAGGEKEGDYLNPDSLNKLLDICGLMLPGGTKGEKS